MSHYIDKIHSGQLFLGKLNFTTSKKLNVISLSGDNSKDYVYDLEINNYHNYVANNIICHNTCAGVAVAEKFKPLVRKYNTKILILVPGPILKENWKYHFIKCTGETYMKKLDKTTLVDPQDLAQIGRAHV